MFRADEPTGERWDFAVKLLREGKQIVTGDIAIDCSGDGDVTIEVCTSEHGHDPNRAEARLQSAQEKVDTLRTSSPEFDDLLKDRPLQFLYVYDDDNTRATLGAFTSDGSYAPSGP